MKVLVVDDSADARLLLRLSLEDVKDIDVVGEAADGREAVEAMATLRPDVVIMDLFMPVMDGIEATRLGKAAAPETEIVGYTSAPTDEYNEAMLEAGATVCFDKTQFSSLLRYLIPTT